MISAATVAAQKQTPRTKTQNFFNRKTGYKEINPKLGGKAFLPKRKATTPKRRMNTGIAFQR